jgi:hypothetical protein
LRDVPLTEGLGLAANKLLSFDFVLEENMTFWILMPHSDHLRVVALSQTEYDLKARVVEPFEFHLSITLGGEDRLVFRLAV